MKTKLLAALRAACVGQMAALGGLEPELPESARAECEELKGEWGKVLAGLPAEGDDPVAEVADGWLEKLVKVMDASGQRLRAAQGELATTLAGMDARVSAAVQAKVDAGELVPAPAAKQAQDQAVETAVAAVNARHTMLAGRRSAVQAANLPLPDESVLGADEAEWAPKLETAKARQASVTEKGLELNSAEVGTLFWGEAVAFEAASKLLEAGLAKAGKQRAKDPDPTAAGGGAGKRVLVC